MINVQNLEMTADKSRYFVNKGTLEALLVRLEAAEAERAILLDTLNGTPCAEIRWQQELQDVTDSRDALEAHVEAGRRIVAEWGRGGFGDEAAAVQLEKWSSAQPETSATLLRKKHFQEAAKLLEEKAEADKHGGGYTAALEDSARYLRSQVEGEKP